MIFKGSRLKANFYILIVSVLVFTGCTTLLEEPPPVQSTQRIPYRVISGSILYPNNLYFPSRVHLEITLMAEHVSTGNTFAVVTQIIRNPQRFPVNFILRYDPRDISRVYEYYLVVELFREEDDRPFLKNLPFPLPPLTGDDNVVLELHEVSTRMSYR